MEKYFDFYGDHSWFCSFWNVNFIQKESDFNPVFYLFATVWGSTSLYSFESHHSPLLNGQVFEICWASSRHKTPNICSFIYCISLLLRCTIFLYFNISELNILHCNHCNSYDSLGCMNLAVTVHIFITSLKLYILLVLHLLSLIAILKCLQKYYSIIWHWSKNLSLMLSHGSRAPLARQMFDIGGMTSISYIFKSSSKSWDLHYL